MRLRHGSSAIAVVVALAATLVLQGCATDTACPTVAYVYRGPVELRVPGQSPTTADVLACFESECTPVPAAVSGQVWELDVEGFVERGGSDQPSSVTAVVTAVETGKELARGAFPVTYERTDGGGRCPGRSAPEPVIIRAESN